MSVHFLSGTSLPLPLARKLLCKLLSAYIELYICVYKYMHLYILTFLSSILTFMMPDSSETWNCNELCKNRANSALNSYT